MLSCRRQVGMVSSSYFSGNLLGTLVAGKLIQRVGFTRSYHLSCLVFAAATAGMVLSIDFGAGWAGASSPASAAHGFGVIVEARCCAAAISATVASCWRPI